MEDAGKGAAGDPALPPQSTTGASKLKPLHVHFAEGSNTAPQKVMRGEKQW